MRRQSSPQHQFIVLNRLSDALFAEDLHEGEPFQIEHHENFVMYQKGNDIDRGVWFYDQRECQGFVELVTKRHAKRILLNTYLYSHPSRILV